MILFDDSYLLLGKSYKLDENITVNNPKLREVFDLGEEKYYSIISPFISTPSDHKVELYDIGVDFETVDPFEFFFTRVKNVKPEDSKILFGDLDFSKMELFTKADTQEMLMVHGDIFINELAYSVMTNFIRKVNGIPVKEKEKYSSEHAKQYRLEVERTAWNASKRKKKESFNSKLIPIVSALVNHPGNPYDYNTIMDLTISQLYDSLDRIQKIKHYDNTMMGLYSGSISSKDINMQQTTWLA